MKPNVIAIVGQTASGKTTLARYLESTGFQRIVTYTTRPMRDGEKDGSDYHFLQEAQFLKMLEEGFFAEHTDYHAKFGHVCYGTGRESLEASEQRRKVIVLNPCGVMALKDAGYDIFVVYLDIDQATLMRRALNRGDSPAEIGRRIAEDARLFRALEAGNYDNLRITDAELLPNQIADMIFEAL